MYIASRSEAKFRDAKQDIIAEHPEADIRLLKLDLADLDNVREAAEWFSQLVITDRPVVRVNIALANEGIARNQVFICLSIMLAYVISLSS